MEKEESRLESQLRRFTGTQRWFRSSTGLLYTDGIQYLAEHAGAYWLIDVVGSWQPKLVDRRFQVWRLSVNLDRTAVVTMVEDDGSPELVRQELEYTDFPLDDFSCYCIDGILLLQSEY
jgi:uncharacterized protein DUF6876